MRKENRELGDWYEDDSYDWLEVLVALAMGVAVGIVVIEFLL